VDPLARLDAVRWESLHHADGRATDVPGHLRSLRSPDPPVRRKALARLAVTVSEQGVRWQASCHVVPFLVALVDDPATPDRPAVLDLLRVLALGTREDQFLPFDPASEFAAAEGVDDRQVALVIRRLERTEEFSDDEWAIANAVTVRWEADAYWAAAAHTDAYLRWLTDPDPDIAARAAALLAWFPASDHMVTELLAVPADRGREQVRASANLTLAHLDAATDAAPVDRRLTELLTAPAAVVRTTAAVALAYRMGHRLPGPARDILVGARDLDVLPATPPGWDRAMRAFVDLALRRAGPD
jgi:hypothetical protein